MKKIMLATLLALSCAQEVKPIFRKLSGYFGSALAMAGGCILGGFGQQILCPDENVMKQNDLLQKSIKTQEDAIETQQGLVTAMTSEKGFLDYISTGNKFVDWPVRLVGGVISTMVINYLQNKIAQGVMGTVNAVAGKKEVDAVQQLQGGQHSEQNKDIVQTLIKHIPVKEQRGFMERAQQMIAQGDEDALDKVQQLVQKIAQELRQQGHSDQAIQIEQIAGISTSTVPQIEELPSDGNNLQADTGVTPNQGQSKGRVITPAKLAAQRRRLHNE